MSCLARFLFFLAFLPLALDAATARQAIRVSYFDEDAVKMHLPNPPNFIKNAFGPSVERGTMLLYERKLLDLMGFISGYMGCNLGRWHMNGDQIFTASAFLSARVWVLHIPFAHTYVEYSIFGPTLLSKEIFNENNFGSNFLIQNFYGAGLELGEGSGLSIDLKMIRYIKHDQPSSKFSIHVPILVSVGFLF